MCASCSNQKARNQERSHGGGSNVGVRVGEVVQHGEPEEGVANRQQTAGDDGGPEGDAAIVGEGEPEERDWETPDTDEGGEETRFGTVGSVLEAVALVEVGLDGDDAEHDCDLLLT